MDPFGLSPLSSFVEGVHTFFNVVGFLPGAGVYADMANAILYLVEGKYGLAGFSVVAAIPGPGDGASLGFNLFKLSKRTKRILKTVGDGASVARDSIFSADIANEVYNRYVVEGEPLDDEGVFQIALAVVNIGCSTNSAKKMLKNARNRSKMHSQSMSRTKDESNSVKYSPINPCDEISQEVAESFSGATFTKTTLAEDTVMYRVSGGRAGEVGSYVSRTPQGGGLQSQLDLALNPSWGNTTENVTKVVVPKGTTIYEGIAAPQNNNDSLGNVIGTLPGGGSQVYIPKVEVGWFK